MRFRPDAQSILWARAICVVDGKVAWFEELPERINQLGKVVAQHVRAPDRFFPGKVFVGDSGGRIFIVVGPLGAEHPVPHRKETVAPEPASIIVWAGLAGAGGMAYWW